MLVLTKRPGERVYLRDDIYIDIVQVKGKNIRLGIEAPRDEFDIRHKDDEGHRFEATGHKDEPDGNK